MATKNKESESREETGCETPSENKTDKICKTVIYQQKCQNADEQRCSCKPKRVTRGQVENTLVKCYIKPRFKREKKPKLKGSRPTDFMRVIFFNIIDDPKFGPIGIRKIDFDYSPCGNQLGCREVPAEARVEIASQMFTALSDQATDFCTTKYEKKRISHKRLQGFTTNPCRATRFRP